MKIESDTDIQYSAVKGRCCLIPELLTAFLMAVTSATIKPIATFAFGEKTHLIISKVQALLVMMSY